MHVDGGATREVFLLPTQFVASKIDPTLSVKPIRRVYIIRNGRVAPEWKAVKAKTLSIAGRAVSTQSRTRASAISMSFTHSPSGTARTITSPSFPGISPIQYERFDPKYMTALYDLGFRTAKAGYPWRKVPPRLGEATQGAAPKAPAVRPKPKPPAEPNISAAPALPGATEPASQSASYY